MPSAKRFGGVPKIRPVARDFVNARPERPVRAIASQTLLPPVLYNKVDQLMELNNALACRRLEMRVMMTVSQLALGPRNADDYISETLLSREVKTESRPNLYQLWFSDNGFQANEHVLHNLGPHELVPIVSLLSYDYANGHMDLYQAEELSKALLTSLGAHSKKTVREVCNQMVRVYALAQQPEKGLKMLTEMKQRHVRRNFVSYAPLFRLARKNLDVDLHIATTSLCLQLEGGRLMKAVFIDIPRVLAVVLVFIRFYWLPIHLLLITIVGGIAVHIYAVTMVLEPA